MDMPVSGPQELTSTMAGMPVVGQCFGKQESTLRLLGLSPRDLDAAGAIDVFQALSSEEGVVGAARLNPRGR